MRGSARRLCSWAALVLTWGCVGPTIAGAADLPMRRAPIGPYLDGAFPAAAPAPSGGWAAVVAFPRLTFEDPIFLVPDPRGGRLYIGGRQGVVWSIADDPNAVTKSVFLDLRSRCQGF